MTGRNSFFTFTGWHKRWDCERTAFPTSQPNSAGLDGTSDCWHAMLPATTGTWLLDAAGLSNRSSRRSHHRG